MLEAKQINAADVNLTNLGTVISIFVVFQIAGLNCYGQILQVYIYGAFTSFYNFPASEFLTQKSVVWIRGLKELKV